MAGQCTTSLRKSGPGCDHRLVTGHLDGVPVTCHLTGAELEALDWSAPLPEEFAALPAREVFFRLGLRYLMDRGWTLDDAAGLITNGVEGNNLKIYPIITKDITRANVGTAYVNVANGANGERKVADFAGCTQFRVRVWANLVGTGPFGYRLVRDADNEVLFENGSIALTGERELDTGWVAIPAGFDGETPLRLQVKSAVGADDPTTRGCDLGVR